MSWILKVGDHIHCPLGEATVRMIEPDKIFIRILSGRFENQIMAYPAPKFFLEAKPVTLEPPSTSEVPAFLRQDSKNDKIRQMKCIDALRFGLVPYDYIKELTLGYSDFEKWVLKSLPDSSEGNCQITHNIIGDYGEGKSHAMGVIRYIALREGYLVGNIEVDGSSVTLSDPKTLIYMLMSSLKAKDLPSTMPLLNLYLKAIHSEGYTLSGDISVAPRGMDRVQRMCKVIETIDKNNLIDECDYLIDVILTCSNEMTAGEVKRDLIEQSGCVIDQFTQVNPMIGSTVADRPVDFLETLIGTTDIAQRAGYKGFIITIDEMEVESRQLKREQYKRTIDLFNVLLSYFNGDTEHAGVPLGICFASVFEERDTVPEEVLNKISDLVKVSGGSMKKIRYFEGWDPNDAEQVTLVKRIHQIYKEAYACNGYSDNEILKKLEGALGKAGTGESGGIRSFIKQYVSYLDSIYGPPNVNLG